jgi:hypothetical protein
MPLRHTVSTAEGANRHGIVHPRSQGAFAARRRDGSLRQACRRHPFVARVPAPAALSEAGRRVMRDADTVAGAGQQFFFEKKNQKTFVS